MQLCREGRYINPFGVSKMSVVLVLLRGLIFHKQRSSAIFYPFPERRQLVQPILTVQNFMIFLVGIFLILSFSNFLVFGAAL